MLIFGVATSISAVHTKLPHHVSGHLSIEIFSGEKSTDLLSKVVEEILLNPEIKFKLGGKCLEMLLDNFLLTDFSVKRFLFGYKYTLMEHQWTENRLMRLDSPDSPLDEIRALKSFRRFVEKDVKSRAILLVDDAAFKRFFAGSLRDLDRVTEKYRFGVKCLHGLSRDLPGAPLGRQLFSVYRTALAEEERVLDSHEYRECFQLLNHLNPDNLRRKLIDFIHVLADFEAEAVKGIYYFDQSP